MRIVLLGAGGLIGSATLARLIAEGHDVLAVTRNGRRLAGGEPYRLDIARATHAADWLPVLTGADAVVNCAGVLQDSPMDSTLGVHANGPAALFEACERSNVTRIIHVSAIGADRGLSAFSRSKRAGEQALMARDLLWVILRPSVVLGRPAYGASALIRGLAALPVLPLAPDTGSLQVVQLDELVHTIVFFLSADAPVQVILDIVGPDPLQFADIVAAYRTWLGWSAAARIVLPRWLTGALYRAGDLASILGWRPPIRSTARQEMVAGAVGDPAEWTSLTGIRPRSLRQALIEEPASVQDRWFAGLYLLKPLVFGILSVFWILTGLLSLGPGWPTGIGLMEEARVGALAAPAVVAGALVDIAIGIGIAFRPTARLAFYAALGVSFFYVVAGTLMLPRLWFEPLGPLLKILPIMVLNLVALAVHEDR